MNMLEVLIFFSNLFFNVVSTLFEITFENIFILCFLIKLILKFIYLVDFKFFFFNIYSYLEMLVSKIEYLYLFCYTIILHVLNLCKNFLKLSEILKGFILNLFSNKELKKNIFKFKITLNRHIIVLFWFNTFFYVYIFTYIYIKIIIYLFGYVVILSSVTNLFVLLKNLFLLSIDWYSNLLNVYYINFTKFMIGMKELLNNFYLAYNLEEEKKMLHEDILEFVKIYVKMRENADLMTKEEDITDLIIELYDLTYTLCKLTYDHYNEYNYIYENFWLWNLAILGFFFYMDYHLRKQLEAQGL